MIHYFNPFDPSIKLLVLILDGCWYHWVSLFHIWIGLALEIGLRLSYRQWRWNEFESGGGAPVQSKSGAPIRRKAPENNFFGRTPPLFRAVKAQLLVSVSAFVMVSTVWSVKITDAVDARRLLFFYSWRPPVPNHL